MQEVPGVGRNGEVAERTGAGCGTEEEAVAATTTEEGSSAKTGGSVGVTGVTRAAQPATRTVRIAPIGDNLRLTTG